MPAVCCVVRYLYVCFCGFVCDDGFVCDWEDLRVRVCVCVFEVCMV